MIVVYNFLKNLMDTNKKYLAIFCFILGAFFSTANIVILNEESLVAICFVIFVATLYVYGRSIISETLEERSRQVSQEFDRLFDLQLKNKELLISCYEHQSGLSAKIRTIFSFSQEEIKSLVAQKEKGLNYIISLQIEQKLMSIFSKEVAILLSLQSEIVKFFTFEIRNLFVGKSVEQQQLKAAVTKESITKLEKLIS